MLQQGKLSRPLKPILGRSVKYVKVILLVSAVASLGVLMGQKGLVQKRELEHKRLQLQAENEHLAEEIKFLEREVTLLRSDPKTIEKAAKRKLGMARLDETVYIFEQARVARKDGSSSDSSLHKRRNMP
jgi:cell division protein FtsB